MFKLNKTNINDKNVKLCLKCYNIIWAWPEIDWITKIDKSDQIQCYAEYVVNLTKEGNISTVQKIKRKRLRETARTTTKHATKTNKKERINKCKFKPDFHSRIKSWRLSEAYKMFKANELRLSQESELSVLPRAIFELFV